MATEVIMPKLGLTMTEGKVIDWKKKEGEIIKNGEPLFTVETDKVAIDVESPASGTLLKILIPTGELVPITEVIAYIGEPGESLPEIKKTIYAPTAETSQPGLAEIKNVQADKQLAGTLPIFISPLARRLAKKNNVDITDLIGSGPQGRIIEADIQKIINERQTGAETITTSINVPSEVFSLNQVKRLTAKRMSESFQTTPHFYLEKEINCYRLVELHKKMSLEMEGKNKAHCTYTDFIIKALAATLPNNPLLNATWANGQIRLYKEVHLGLAISTPLGLMVGVIHRTEKLTLDEISAVREALTQRAKDGKLTQDDVTNGTFTLTNLGMLGIDSFTPIINPPQSAILAIGALADRPIVDNSQLVVRPTLKMTLAVDHRVADGVEAAALIKDLSELLDESPESLLG